MNVAILVKEFPPDVIGGTETQTQRMARALEARGHDVTVYTKSYGNEEGCDEPFELVRVPNLRTNDFVSTLTFVLVATLYLLRNAGRHDVLQCMMIYPNGFVGYVVSTLTRLPYFAWIRGGDYYFMKDTPGKRTMIRTVLADTTVLAQSAEIARDVRSEFDAADLRVLGNGVDIGDPTESGDGVVFVGRLVDWKGVDVLLRALDGTGERLVVVGDGPERDRLESLAASLDVDARFVGMVPTEEVDAYLAAGAVFALPSTGDEGLPNAVIEAMAAGLPVVTTDSGGLPDLVEDGETGFVVPKGDVEALRSRIRTLMDDDERRARMGHAAWTYARDHHGWDHVVAALESVYDSCRRSDHNS